MRFHITKKVTALLLAACLIITAVSITVFAGTDNPTVTFDGGEKAFSFDHVTKYTDVSGTRTYFDLFRDIKNAMPGDSFTQDITVGVKNVGKDKVRLRLKSENANADYEALMREATLSVSNGTEIITGNLAEGVSLGLFDGDRKDANITVKFSIPLTAGNELQNLTSEIDWVFTAEIMPPPELDKENHFGYIIGRGKNSVQPEAFITRAEVVTIFFRMLTDDSRSYYWKQTNSYSDVPSNAWYNNAVSTMTNAGIINGYKDGTFRPNGFITRAEFAAMAVRFYQIQYQGKDLFTDISRHWARDYINKAGSIGLINGYSDGTFRPEQNITRAEAITIMNRTLERKPHKDHLLPDMITWADNMDPDVWYYAHVQEATNSHECEIVEAEGETPAYERWTKILPPRDWSALEREWSQANSKAVEIISSSTAMKP